MMIQRTKASFAVILLWVAEPSFATSQMDRGIADLFEHSTNVFEGQVISASASCDENHCTSNIAAVLTASYKGMAKRRETMRFCGTPPVTVGFNYIFFLEPAPSSQARCSHYAERDAVFQRFEERVYRYMSPGSFEILQKDGVRYLTGWIEEKGFDRLLLARDSEAPEGMKSTYDAALGIAIRAMANYSTTCKVKEEVRNDLGIAGVLYADNYVVEHRSKSQKEGHDLYRYILRDAKARERLRAEVLVSGGACIGFSVEKIANTNPSGGS